MTKLRSIFIAFLFATFSLGLMSSKSETEFPAKDKDKNFDLKKMFETAKGGKLSFKEKLVLKIFGKKIRKSINQPEITKNRKKLHELGYIFFGVTGLGFIGIGLVSHWKGKHWWIALLLFFLLVIPAIVYTFFIMGKYYK